MKEPHSPLYRWFFDFSEELRPLKKFDNILYCLAFNFFWTFSISGFLRLLGHSEKALDEALSANILLNVLGPMAILGIPAFKLFFVCVVAPLWEEFVFRVFPLNLHRTGFLIKNYRLFLLHFSLFSSMLFGLLHGSPINLLFQSMAGFTLCWLYLKNNRSYVSIVATHAIWNLIVFSVTPK